MRTREGEEVRIVRTDRGGVHQKVAHPPDKVAPYWWYHIGGRRCPLPPGHPGRLASES